MKVFAPAHPHEVNLSHCPMGLASLVVLTSVLFRRRAVVMLNPNRTVRACRTTPAA